jgi:hypothetical protein
LAWTVTVPNRASSWLVSVPPREGPR